MSLKASLFVVSLADSRKLHFGKSAVVFTCLRLPKTFLDGGGGLMALTVVRELQTINRLRSTRLPKLPKLYT
jgi:hypothetical protein